MPFTTAGTFITSQDLEDKLGRDVNTDPAALAAVEIACDICRNWAGKSFTRGTVTEVFDGNGTDALMLGETPVNSVSSVRVSSSAGTATAGSLDYVYTLNGNGILYATDTAGTWAHGTCWPVGRQNIAVTYDYGYDTVPSDVCGVALSVAERLLVQGPALFENMGDVGIRYAAAQTELTPTEQLYLYRHRRRR